MAIHSINNYQLLINQQIQFQETLCDHLLKLEALVAVALGEGFLLHHSLSTIHHYLWVMSDLIEETSKQNQRTLDTLLANKPLAEKC